MTAPHRTSAVPRVLVLVLAATLGACSTVPPTPVPTEGPTTEGPTDPAPETVELTVFAAASLGEALEAVQESSGIVMPGMTLTISTGSSAALAAQITEGAPADVFLSADTEIPQKLVDAGLVDGNAVAFAGNELVVITPTDDPAGLTSPFDLAKPGIRVIAAGDDVPITRYADQLVANLAADPGAPPDFAAAYAANVASKEDDVSAVRAKVELGEGDAAIVYVTDAAAAADRIARVEVPDEVNVPATYAGVVIAASEQGDAAHAFLDWLTGPDGQAVLSDFEFRSPTP